MIAQGKRSNASAALGNSPKQIKPCRGERIEMSLAQRKLNWQTASWMGTDSGNDQNIPPEILEEIRGAVRIGITFTSRNIFGEKLSLQEVLKVISLLNRNEAIIHCAEWNRWNTWVLFHSGTWKNAHKDQQRLVDELVPPNAQSRAMAVFNDEKFVSPFSEISVLALIGLLCRFTAGVGGESLNTRQAQRALFRALLALQESILPDNFFDLSVPEQFPFEVRLTLANISLQNRWSYDMGRLHSLLTVPEISNGLNGITVQAWFLNRLGLDGKDYECAANTFLGSAFYHADYSRLQEQAPALYQRMGRLLELSTAAPEDVVKGLNALHPQADPAHLSDAVAYSNLLLVRPMMRLGERLVCTSPRNLFNKIHRGLPYLCLEARTNPGEQKTRPRDEFGYIFEAYVSWLMKQWIAGHDIRFVTN
jgi:hypothetical protein